MSFGKAGGSITATTGSGTNVVGTKITLNGKVKIVLGDGNTKSTLSFAKGTKIHILPNFSMESYLSPSRLSHERMADAVALVCTLQMRGHTALQATGAHPCSSLARARSSKTTPRCKATISTAT